jgi:hypothetical protein
MGGKGSGPRPGFVQAGPVRGWLLHAQPGEVFWTEQNSRQVESTAGRVGVGCYAVHPATRTVYEVTRIGFFWSPVGL